MRGGLPRMLTALAVTTSLIGTTALASARLSEGALPLAAKSQFAPSPTLSPMVALSAFGSRSSVTALCSGIAAAGQKALDASDTSAQGAAGAPATTDVAAPVPVAGCVLPMTDAPPVGSVSSAVPPPPPGFVPFAIGPLLAGLAAAGGSAAAISAGGRNAAGNSPISIS